MPNNILEIKVSCPGQEDVVFKLNKDTEMLKVIERYCSQILHKKSDGLIFTYDGIEIKKNDTPEKLKMKNNDVIHVNVMQTGGSFNEINQ